MCNGRVTAVGGETHSLSQSVPGWAVNCILNQNRNSFISLRVLYSPTAAVTGQKTRTKTQGNE